MKLQWSIGSGPGVGRGRAAAAEVGPAASDGVTQLKSQRMPVRIVAFQVLEAKMLPFNT